MDHALSNKLCSMLINGRLGSGSRSSLLDFLGFVSLGAGLEEFDVLTLTSHRVFF
jgi:hypothetical protein